MLALSLLLLMAPAATGLADPDRASPTQQSAAAADLATPAAEGTSRTGTVSGFSLGTDLGISIPTPGLRRGPGVGAGALLGLRLGLALWDQLSIDAGGGVLLLRDLRPYTELVETCITTSAMPSPSCSVADKASTFTGWMVFAEAGYQRRFRPSPATSLLPGLHLGYMAGPSELTRAVECDGCKKMTVPGVHLQGLYVAPFLRMTFGATGVAAITLRSMVFLTGDLMNLTLLSYEFIAP